MNRAELEERIISAIMRLGAKRSDEQNKLLSGYCVFIKDYHLYKHVRDFYKLMEQGNSDWAGIVAEIDKNVPDNIKTKPTT